jgi:hypothetical protein
MPLGQKDSPLKDFSRFNKNVAMPSDCYHNPQMVTLREPSDGFAMRVSLAFRHS